MIYFDEVLHKYTNEKGQTLTSVTQLIEKYTNTFDKQFWGMYTALKDRGYKVKPEPEKQSIYIAGRLYKISDLMKDSLYKAYYDEICIKWEINTKEACMRGNVIHNELEDNINKSAGNIKLNDYINMGKQKKLTINKQDLDITDIPSKYPEVYTRLNAYINAGFTIFSEKRVYIEEFLIAGTIDVPIIKDNRFVILDWKTNKDELHRTAGYYKKVNVGGAWIKSNDWVETTDCLLHPLSHIPASKYHKYSLQLSLYAYILEQWGYSLCKDGLEIIHFMPNKKPVLIKIPYLKNEIIIMLQHHKQYII